MKRNVEIKAKVEQLDGIEKKVAVLATDGPYDLVQEDTYFVCDNGRLKLRCHADGINQLVYYSRSDRAQPTPSEYVLHRVDDAPTLKAALGGALGVRGVVRKCRRLYLIDNTRVHLDAVDELGNFVELEVVLAPSMTLEQGDATARTLLTKLGIADHELLKPSYIDLLLSR